MINKHTKKRALNSFKMLGEESVSNYSNRLALVQNSLETGECLCNEATFGEVPGYQTGTDRGVADPPYSI